MSFMLPFFSLISELGGANIGVVLSGIFPTTLCLLLGTIRYTIFLLSILSVTQHGLSSSQMHCVSHTLYQMFIRHFAWPFYFLYLYVLFSSLTVCHCVYRTLCVLPLTLQFYFHSILLFFFLFITFIFLILNFLFFSYLLIFLNSHLYLFHPFIISILFFFYVFNFFYTCSHFFSFL
jgi:hypothetical protein